MIQTKNTFMQRKEPHRAVLVPESRVEDVERMLRDHHSNEERPVNLG